MLLSASEASGSGGLTQLQLPKEVEFMDDKKVCKLPRSSNCSSQVEFSLKGNFELTALSPIYFRRMSHLQVLDLSHTSIKSLPKSLFKLISLKSLMLRGCQLFMELSPQVGKLTNLEELDLDQTEIMDLPIEIGELPKLRQLRVSFYQTCGKQKLKWNVLIHPETVSILTKLTELSIDVNPADKRWDDLVEAVVQAACKSMTLRTLSLFLPKFQLLDYLSSIYHSLSRFRFTVGHHKRRIISRVPHEVEAEFRNWEKCLKFVNGDTIPIEIQGALKYSTSFFLENHVPATSLSEFGIENMKRLKVCLLAECDNMETIIDGERHHKGYEDDGSESDLGSAKTALESLEYMNIYYMDNLTSICRGPNGFGYMPKLKILALHTCPRLINIFSHSMLENFVNLEELILEDCPQVTSLVSHASVIPMMSDKFLPSLKRLLLLYLPQLVTISNGLPIAPKLESIGFYNCPKLKSISKMELSSKSLNIIKGESQWWKDLNWDESEWGNWPDYLRQIFLPINHEQDVMTQMAEDKDIFEATIQNESKNLDCLEERKTGTDVTKPSHSECVFPSIPELEGNGREKKQRKTGEKMTEQGRGSRPSAPTRPTITLPPRPTMDGLFSGSGLSPGPMTLVSTFFSEPESSEYSHRSFSQLLARAMASPGARLPYSSMDGSIMDIGFNEGGEKSPGFKQNLTPLFTVPPGLSPSGLLNSPAFFSVSPQSPFGMSQQALAQVTAQAAFAQSRVHAQPEYQNLSSAAHKETSQQLPPSASEPQSCAMKYSEALQSNRKNQPCVAVDKPAEDGYNWRKYGQKPIEGCEYPRSYYKCTHLNCPVKKKVERSADGQITEIIYKGAHNHDKPQSNKQAKGGSEGNANSQANPEQGSQGAAGNLIKLIEAVPAYSMPGKNHESTESAMELPSDREEGCDEESRQEKDEDEPNAKRRNTSAESAAVLSHKKIWEPKIIVQTRSEVDLLNDGYRWRKYGQKLVKGSPNPRSYYKCSSAGCNVRKSVERASTDPKAFITTYEGKHNHDVLPILQEITRFSWGKPSVGSPQ